jgi:hypothetical protein
MTTATADAGDYLRLFERWHALLPEAVGPDVARDFGDVYQAGTDDERFRLLFQQVCQLLVTPSPFNLAMPQEFRRTAQQWLNGDAATRAHMGEAQMRHFMLSDLHDYVHLSRAMGMGWA